MKRKNQGKKMAFSLPFPSLNTSTRISPVFVSCWIVLTLCTGLCVGESCTFTSRNYSVGDVWYPRLGQRGALYCVACICQEGGKINCTMHQCGQDCSSPHSTNECCLYCPKEIKSSTLSTSLISRPLIGNGSETAAGGETATTCLHNGNVYRHKERFTSSSIGLKPEHPNQCVQCTCEAGMVLCQLKDCPKPECENPIRTREDCCPVCPDPAGRLDEMNNSPVVIQQPDTKMEDCISGGRYYLHGTTWHPVMGPFGPMDCVICECKSGRIECQRLECPNRQTLNCEKPVKVAGRCCPVCPLEQEGFVTSISPSSPVPRDVPRPPLPSHGSAPRSSVRASPSSRPPSTTTSMKSPNSLSLCLPTDHDVIVYRAQGGGNASEFIQYIFQKIGLSGAIEHHLWMLQTSTTTYKVQDLTKDQADALRQRFRFAILGATTTKNVKRFTKREKKLKPKCLPGSGCPKKIRRLERNLSLKEVANRKACLATEIEAS